MRLKSAIYASLCVFTVLVCCFDCVVSLATREEMKSGSEWNPLWVAFLRNGTIRSLTGLKFVGIFLASGVMYRIRNYRRVRFSVMVPLAAAHLWLFMVLNFGVQGNLFLFNFSHPLELVNAVFDAIIKGAVRR